MNELLQRKKDLKPRIALLSDELKQHKARVENLEERIKFLESDLRDVLDAIRIAENKQRKGPAPDVETVRNVEWVPCG
ncbi:MAG: hypothetical protein JO119_13555 [Acidobacteria bacterium]|nr:hypothetical protein [Acidobacteriota bacterium]